MRTATVLLTTLLIACCSTVSVPKRYVDQKGDYIRGLEDAKKDNRNGVRRIAAIECYEEDDWRTLWVMRRLLKERYSIDYNVISPSPLPPDVAYVEGYNSIALPQIETILGKRWYQRLWSDAESYKKLNWKKLKDD